MVKVNGDKKKASMRVRVGKIRDDRLCRETPKI